MRLEDITLITLDVLKKNYDAFLHHLQSSLDEAKEQNLRLSSEINEEICRVFEARPDRRDNTDALSILNYLGKINYNLGKINENVNNKINDGVMLTDTAALELGELFGGTIESLLHVRQALVIVNPILIKNVVDESKDLWTRAQGYAAEHEDRLIRGICMPKASLLYLLILDSLKDILWFSMEIAKCIKYEETA